MAGWWKTARTLTCWPQAGSMPASMPGRADVLSSAYRRRAVGSRMSTRGAVPVCVNRVRPLGLAGSAAIRVRVMAMQFHHVQVACPSGAEALLRGFYCGVLGLTEVPKPPRLAADGGAWFRDGESGAVEI